MPVTTLSDLFYDTLRDIYWAEKHLLKALPKMSKKAANPELAEALEIHRVETEGHVERLEQVFEVINKAPRAKKCEAMVGLSAEGDHVLEEVEDETVRDVGIIGAAQAVEHYEIARYGTLATWAKLLGHEDAAKLLGATLEEEKAADEILSGLAESINAEAEFKEEETA
jgi:ferritin-like metal-binding protein YciE